MELPPSFQGLQFGGVSEPKPGVPAEPKIGGIPEPKAGPDGLAPLSLREKIMTGGAPKRNFGSRVILPGAVGKGEEFYIKRIVLKSYHCLPEFAQEKAKIEAKAVTILTASGERVTVNIKSLAKRLNLSEKSILDAVKRDEEAKKSEKEEKTSHVDSLIATQLKIISSPRVKGAFASIERMIKERKEGAFKEGFFLGNGFYAVQYPDDTQIHLYHIKDGALGVGATGVALRMTAHTPTIFGVMKVPHPFRQEQAVIQQRLRREAQVLGAAHKRGHITSVEHVPRIVTYQGKTALMKHYYPGGDLQGWISPKKSFDERFAIVRAISTAREQLWERKIVNMDIKPENIFLAEDGTPFIADWDGGMVFDEELAKGPPPVPTFPPRIAFSPAVVPYDYFTKLNVYKRKILDAEDRLAEKEAKYKVEFARPARTAKEAQKLERYKKEKTEKLAKIRNDLSKMKGECELLANEAMDYATGHTLFETLTGVHPNTLSYELPSGGYAAQLKGKEFESAADSLVKAGCNPAQVQMVMNYFKPVKDRKPTDFPKRLKVKSTAAPTLARQEEKKA
jgi:serine/threonine protein kinase